jgi:hypothetical protein
VPGEGGDGHPHRPDVDDVGKFSLYYPVAEPLTRSGGVTRGGLAASATSTGVTDVVKSTGLVQQLARGDSTSMAVVSLAAGDK